jgi:DNA primase
MARMIKRDDIAAVRERARIDEIVSQFVTLRPAGVGSMKGLCPFHDERTPSFHVRPQVGHWHCFGCGEGGDVISFVQKINHMGFAEAVEWLADRSGVQLHYDDDGGTSRPREDPGRRQRLIESHSLAEQFYRDQLRSPEAVVARRFLAERGFDQAAADAFAVGYAPKGWDNLARHLRGKGFTEAELAVSGLCTQGNRGVYDRFRGRLMWPIRDITGTTVGFGTRRLHEDDQGPKYLNTPETALYKKSHVLYGLDLARKSIATQRQVVVVEGYTDVMAAHLAGVTTAVATCGTAFGEDHIRIVRRLLGDVADESAGVSFSSQVSRGGQVIFTFDGDAAGQKAALKAFDEDQRFASQTFVAVEPSGMDPCELRMARGDEALAALIASRVPLFEFAIRTALAAVDLNTAEGRVGALRAAAPVVGRIRDRALRAEYSRELAGWLGMDEGDVRRAVGGSERRDERQTERPDRPRQEDPVAKLEREALEVVLQLPATAVRCGFDDVGAGAFVVPAHRAVHDAIRAAGGAAAAGSDVVGWVDEVRAGAPEPVARLVTGMAVAPLPVADDAAQRQYAAGILTALIRMALTRTIGDIKGELQRTDPGSERYNQLFGELIALETQRRALGEDR